MKLPRLIKQVGKHILQSIPVLRRHILTSTDYMVLGGPEEARQAQASSPGWLASRTVARQERGSTMVTVERKFGAPVTRHPTVGAPPITRWDYPAFSVFFERDRVIHAVVTSG